MDRLEKAVGALQALDARIEQRREQLEEARLWLAERTLSASVDAIAKRLGTVQALELYLKTATAVRVGLVKNETMARQEMERCRRADFERRGRLARYAPLPREAR